MKITLLILLLFIANAFSQNQIAFSVLSNGGEIQANSAYVIVGTLGQTSIGKCENTINQAQAGFWQMYYQNVLQAAEDENMLPIEYKLEQNYPNPFNPSTIIKFGIPERNNVLIKIYDILGSEVTTLLNHEMDAGWYELIFNAAEYSTGIYICRMQAGNYVSTKKMLMLK
ncbi:MAG: hypothetical protein A2315_15175 [Ignavibacteria bacterium RIFOXYB2_FULL_35_12]|nr:MAG: hypothetical protein A2058_05385 [Ignavibacteria bacterium GWA2_36_19]OGU62374.1 MAG: hypothetical protein A2X60_13825 [Ignavibacteria bacterium GWF2_35_20]OGU86309.1 MAG: hypothetical protein A3K31_02415 [Ignavibacteria bacterium RIFOXYA12_FULL_35_25]OGU87458.1 MAG: hypothetical protein A2492_00955 [Ignavibacteria bacterium RIFOXYC12_FULL_35_11]OGU97593.1 MAG: hypothetical protein A2347_09040 [Ignavibacteria bacterium RIFOXYB12_FULL_35_14]OGV00515.1 MAG: hypothetical protein A2455_167